MRNKVTVVGAGNLGASCAMNIAQKRMADVVLADVVYGHPQGKALDIHQSGPLEVVKSMSLGLMATMKPQTRML